MTVDEVTILYAENGVPGFTEPEVELVGDGGEPDLERLGRPSGVRTDAPETT